MSSFGEKSHNDYEELSAIEIEIKPINNKYDKFINIDKKDEKYYHIYLNNNKEEIKRNYIRKNEKVKIITIIIDYQVTSFKNLFAGCFIVESINFKKFNRNNITDMSRMFFGCSSLKELNLNNFNTNNVKSMNAMFEGCSSLLELNLNHFKTSNDTDMGFMFAKCTSLKELNINNIKSNIATNVRCMFNGCSDEFKMKIRNQNKNIPKNAFENLKSPKW